MPATASGRSANSAAISSGGFRYRSALRRQPPAGAARASVLWWMQVSTSNSGRSAGSAKRTPLVATIGTWNADGRDRASACVVGLFVAQRDAAAARRSTDSRAEHADEAIEQPADAVAPAVERRAAGERDQAAVVPVELLERQRALAFRRAQLHARDQPAQVAGSPRRDVDRATEATRDEDVG